MYRHLSERSVESGYMLRNFSELKSGGGTIPMLSPPALKSGGGRVPAPPPPIDARENSAVPFLYFLVGVDHGLRASRDQRHVFMTQHFRTFHRTCALCSVFCL